MEKVLLKKSYMEKEDWETGDPDIRTMDISRGATRIIRTEDRGSFRMIIGMIDLSKGFEMEDSEDTSRKYKYRGLKN